MGRFVSVIGIERPTNVSQFPTDKLASQICQHVIGMQPETLGTPPQKQQATIKTENTSEAAADGEKDELNEFYSGTVRIFFRSIVIQNGNGHFTLPENSDLDRNQIYCCVRLPNSVDNHNKIRKSGR